MPILSKFYGIVIRMYFQLAEHNPPHIHASYGGNVAEIEIKSGDVLDGSISPKALSLVKEWLVIHRQELLEMWETQEFRVISPLE